MVEEFDIIVCGTGLTECLLTSLLLLEGIVFY